MACRCAICPAIIFELGRHVIVQVRDKIEGCVPIRINNVIH